MTKTGKLSVATMGLLQASLHCYSEKLHFDMCYNSNTLLLTAQLPSQCAVVQGDLEAAAHII